MIGSHLIHNEITSYICLKLTKMGSITGQRIDYLVVQRGQRHLLDKNLPKYPILREDFSGLQKNWIEGVGSPTVSRDAILVVPNQNGIT